MLESSKVPALTRAIDILNLIARIGPCSAAIIIETLRIPKSTAYLLLNELKRQRFISLDHQDNYCLWTKLVELSGHALSKMDLRELARPRLTQLMDETGLLCHLGIIDHENAYYILKVESSSTISVRSHEGKILSLYRSGIGKCLLAWQPAAVRKAIIEQLVWERATLTTITEPQQLNDELERIRQRGWSFDNGEDYPDVRCVAAPVFNARNELTAAISVVGTRLQINEENLDYLAGKVLPVPKIFHACWDGKVPSTHSHLKMENIMTLPKIKHVRAWFIGGATAEKGAGGGDYHDQGGNHWIDDHIATPMSKYRDYEQSRQSFGINVLGTLIVEVEAENGQTGFAVSTAGEMGCFIVEKHLNRFIEGKCVSDIKLIHDQMLGATMYYSGSGGLVMNTISCVDLALWDLFGKVVGLPIYKLLGGAVRDEIQFYATGARPDLAKEMGFIGGKMPTHWGPHDGDAGIRKDAAMVADMREKCGPDFWLMLDCWMSQDVNYATKLAHACAPFNLKWIEECLPPQQYEGYRELKRNAPAGMMVTSGEHHGTLQSFRTLAETGIDIMQPDVGWCGGLTTLVEIAALAKSRGQLVVPHGSSVYSHHAVITFTNTPFSEFLMTSPDCSTLRPQFDPILLDEPVPVNGRIHKSVLDKPGFGVELNRDCHLKRPYSH